MKESPEGRAIVYCQGAFNTPNGKTAHGLVRFTKRYRVLSVIDSGYAGGDAGAILDNRPNGIPIVSSLEEALRSSEEGAHKATHFVVGLAPDGGRLAREGRSDARLALEKGLHVDSGLHDFLSEDPELAALARQKNVRIRDVRKPPPRDQQHFFSGKIEEVDCLKIALLGTDSAVGKRTTAWILVHGLCEAGLKADLVGTGQTAWMQGARYGIVMDSLVNDFVSGEIENVVWSCWAETRPDVIVIEGQGSLMNPAYPGGYEILAAGRPDVVILQHAPNRKEYDGFPGYPLHPLSKQIQAIELISGKPVIAVTLNHEGMEADQVRSACAQIREENGIPAFDVLLEDVDVKGLVDLVRKRAL